MSRSLLNLQLFVEVLRLGRPLGLGPPVLEPDLDLGVRQLKVGGEGQPLLHAEVGGLLVAGLQPAQLHLGEGGPWLPVRPVLPQRAPQRGNREWMRLKVRGHLVWWHAVQGVWPVLWAQYPWWEEVGVAEVELQQGVEQGGGLQGEGEGHRWVLLLLAGAGLGRGRGAGGPGLELDRQLWGRR